MAGDGRRNLSKERMLGRTDLDLMSLVLAPI